MYLFLFFIILLIGIIGCYLAPSLTIETFRNFIEFFSIFIFAKILIETQIKKRQEFLKTIPEGGMADPETGAMIYRAAKPATTTAVVVTLK